MQKFQIGDVVRNVHITTDKTEIVTQVDYTGQGTFAYATDKSAWHLVEDLELVRRADAESFARLDSILEAEEDA